MSKSKEQLVILKTSPSISSDRSGEKDLIFNILGKIYRVKESLFPNQSNLKQFYDPNREQYIIDTSPIIFENILQYFSTQKLVEPPSISNDYYREVLKKFQIDTSSFDIDERYYRYVPRQATLQFIHILFEYANC